MKVDPQLERSPASALAVRGGTPTLRQAQWLEVPKAVQFPDRWVSPTREWSAHPVQCFEQRSLEGLVVHDLRLDRTTPGPSVRQAANARLLEELQSRVQGLEEEVKDLRLAVFGEDRSSTRPPGQAWIHAHADFIESHPMQFVAVDLSTGRVLGHSMDAVEIEKLAEDAARGRTVPDVFTFFTSFVHRNG